MNRKSGFEEMSSESFEPIKPLIDNWLHCKGKDHKMTNTWYVASVLCGTATMRLPTDQNDYAEKIALIDHLKIIPGLKEPKNEFDFAAMKQNSEKAAEFFKKLHSDDEKYLELLLKCKKVLDTRLRA